MFKFKIFERVRDYPSNWELPENLKGRRLEICDTCDGDGWLEYGAILDFDEDTDFGGGRVSIIGEGDDRIILNDEYDNMQYLCYMCDGFGAVEPDTDPRYTVGCGMCDTRYIDKTHDEYMDLHYKHLYENRKDAAHKEFWDSIKNEPRAQTVADA